MNDTAHTVLFPVEYGFLHSVSGGPDLELCYLILPSLVISFKQYGVQQQACRRKFYIIDLSYTWVHHVVKIIESQIDAEVDIISITKTRKIRQITDCK